MTVPLRWIYYVWTKNGSGNVFKNYSWGNFWLNKEKPLVIKD